MALTSNEPTSLTSEGSKDDAMTDTVRLAAVVLGVITALGVILMAVTVFALSSRSNFHEKTVGTEQQHGINKNGRDAASGVTVIAPDLHFERTVPSLTSKSTTSTTKESTGHATEEPFTVPDSTDVETDTTASLPTTETPKKDTSIGLLCTIGDKLSTPEMLPKDGPCDYLFYDSVYKKGFTQFDHKNADPSLSIFLANREAVKRSAIGIGFAYKYRQQLWSDLSKHDRVPSAAVKHFLDENICNFGILDTPTNGFNESSVEEMRLILQSLDYYSTSRKAPDETCVTVFAGPPADTTLEGIYVNQFSRFYTPSIIVIISHYLEGDNTFKDCRVVLPAMLKRPPLLTTNSSYTYDMSAAADSIRRLVARGVNAQWALSVTMKGRWNRLKDGQPAAFLSECVYDPNAESFGSYTEVCEDPSFTNGTRYKTGVYGPLYYNQSDGRTFTFDNETTHVDKLCKLKAQQWSYAFGVAAYDVDYDDFSNVCSSTNYFGNFSRLFYIKGLLDFIEDEFRDPDKLGDCLANSK
ncbi:hypothetical protein MTO96_017644 [Rhipicephalus appendiculatus]